MLNISSKRKKTKTTVNLGSCWMFIFRNVKYYLFITMVIIIVKIHISCKITI